MRTAPPPTIRTAYRKALDMPLLHSLGAAALAVSLVVPAAPNPDFPNPEEAPNPGVIVPALPAPYQTSVEDVCDIASIPCEPDQLATGLGYTVEAVALRVRLLEGTQIVNALNVEAVIEIRDSPASYGFLEVIPVCVVMDGVDAGTWTVNGDSDTFTWADEDTGTVLSDVYLAMVTTAECDPLLERRDILTIATWAGTSSFTTDLNLGGWVSYLGNFITLNYPGRACRTSLACITVEVIDAPEYGDDGVVTLEYTWYGHQNGSTAGAFDGSSLAPSVKAGSWSVTSGTAAMYTSSSWGGGSPSIGEQRTVSYNVTSLECIAFGESSAASTCAQHFTAITTGGGNYQLVPLWYPPGHPNAVPPAAIFTASSLTAYDVFASIIHRALNEGAYMAGVGGVCEDFAECVSRCDHIWPEIADVPTSPTEWAGHAGSSLGMFVSCYLFPSINFSEWWKALQLEVTRSRFTGDVMTLGTYIFSPLRAIGAQGRSCGTLTFLAAGTGGFDEGVGVNTCTWADDYPSTVTWGWALGVALAWFAAAMLIFRILTGALGLRDPLIGDKKKDDD